MITHVCVIYSAKPESSSHSLKCVIRVRLESSRGDSSSCCDSSNQQVWYVLNVTRVSARVAGSPSALSARLCRGAVDLLFTVPAVHGRSAETTRQVRVTEHGEVPHLSCTRNLHVVVRLRLRIHSVQFYIFLPRGRI